MRQTDRPAKIAIVDDRAFRRAAITRLIESWDGQVEGPVTEVASLDALLSADAARHDLYLVVTGRGTLDDRRFQTAIRQLRVAESESAIVFVSDHDAPTDARAALELGIDGFLPTSMEPDVALAALGFIMSGGAYFPPRSLETAHIERHAAAARHAASSSAARDDADRPGEASRHGHARSAGGMHVALTARQEDVLLFLRSGKSNKEIANALDLSEATVKVHVRQLMKKLGVANRTQVALIAAGPDGPDAADLAAVRGMKGA